ncbi:MAG: type II secretion system GspH family protein [Puniceicoccales bacterium]|jgi:prepilin-type N-terminal cleavage/methylation domain-containing protein|nr:type II secretion system GspH family protein [Puniceicoccales bacterium]
MKKGFSLLEIVLALGILGVALPMLLSYMAENVNDSTHRIQMLRAKNMEKNLRYVLEEIRVPLPLDANDCTFCGYKNDCFTVATSPTGWDNASPYCLIELEQNILLGEYFGNSIRHYVYGLYPWNASSQMKQGNWKGSVQHWIGESILGS